MMSAFCKWNCFFAHECIRSQSFVMSINIYLVEHTLAGPSKSTIVFFPYYVLK